MTYLLSLSSIGLLAIDLSFSLYNEYHGNISEQDSHTIVFSWIWNIAQWGTILFGTVLNKFFQKYWTSGHFNIGRRIVHALKVKISY